MAELERMVSQKVQSLHERGKAKEDAFRVGPHVSQYVQSACCTQYYAQLWICKKAAQCSA